MQAKISWIAAALALTLGAAPAAWAGVELSVGINPFGVVTGPPPPVVYAPAPVYAPPPVVYVGGGHWGGPDHRRDWHRDRHRR
jgi:hypothetical protein